MDERRSGHRVEDRIEVKVDAMNSRLDEHIEKADRIHTDLIGELRAMRDELHKALYGNGTVGLLEQARGFARQLKALFAWQHSHDGEHAQDADRREGDGKYLRRRLVDAAWDTAKILLAVALGVFVSRAGG